MLALSNLQLVGAVSAISLTLAVTPLIHAQRAPATLKMVASGCVTQLPDSAGAPPTGHEQAAAKGLTLTRATVRASDGAPPRQTVPVEQSFWLVGARSAELTRFIGKRVEVSGTIDDRLAPNPGTPSVTDAGAAAARRAATAPSDTPSTAHPSAPSRAISVLSFKVVDEHCS